MNQNTLLLKELYELKMKVNTIIDIVHANMRKNNEELLSKYNYSFSSESETEINKDVDIISNSNNESNDVIVENIPNFMSTIIDKTNKSSMNPIIHNKIPWVPPKNMRNKHK